MSSVASLARAGTISENAFEVERCVQRRVAVVSPRGVIDKTAAEELLRLVPTLPREQSPGEYGVAVVFINFEHVTAIERDAVSALHVLVHRMRGTLRACGVQSEPGNDAVFKALQTGELWKGFVSPSGSQFDLLVSSRFILQGVS